MKVENFVFSRKLPPGVLKHIINENKTYQKLFDSYTTFVFTRQPIVLDESNNIVLVRLKSNSIALMLLEFYRTLMKRNRDYDEETICFVRNIKTDFIAPFVYPFLKNIIPVHHTKEIGECLMVKPKGYGALLALIEFLTGSFKLLFIPHVAAVTKDIFDYQCRRTLGEKRYIHYPNGVDFNHIDAALENRAIDQLNFIMVAGHFSEWHGVRIAVRMLERARQFIDTSITLHLVGEISDKIESDIIGVESYGFLDGESLNNVFDKCNFAIGSMNMAALNMTESASLKTREYLSRGIPVISSTPDIELPSDYPYYLVLDETDITRLKNFVDRYVKTPRYEVRVSARQHVDKYCQGQRLKARLVELFSTKVKT